MTGWLLPASPYYGIQGRQEGPCRRASNGAVDTEAAVSANCWRTLSLSCERTRATASTPIAGACVDDNKVDSGAFCWCRL